ncbi:hypothetical protein WR25_26682 isoform C [Diploscapter pachys]|uniref:Hint domain-containing protein n=1 Tax=Diploscapter pachys TaxID=2018661 RepID=A0A2A2L8F8_9BILA|nr:hypothetical protein WR25_26682 isoform C [Diploscapter pachys]
MWQLLLLLPLVASLSYRCQEDQVLVVQSFGNDTIRMHCQRLDLCGYENLKCNYDVLQPKCGGNVNFVSHVSQQTSTAPVEHTCCTLFNPRPPYSVPTHTGNDCFLYELPDGSSGNVTQAPSDGSEQYTVLKSSADIPTQLDGLTGYHLRLFLLTNKAPPTLLVKGIERQLQGYRVTICRPKCIAREDTENYEKSIINIEGDEEKRWKAIRWSSWKSETWSSWNVQKQAAAAAEKAARERQGLAGIGAGGLGGIAAVASASASANAGGDAKGDSNNESDNAANSSYENQNANTGDANAGSKGDAGAAQRENAQGDKSGNININIYTPGARESDGGPAAVANANSTSILNAGNGTKEHENGKPAPPDGGHSGGAVSESPLASTESPPTLGGDSSPASTKPFLVGSSGPIEVGSSAPPLGESTPGSTNEGNKSGDENGGLYGAGAPEPEKTEAPTTKQPDDKDLTTPEGDNEIEPPKNVVDLPKKNDKGDGKEDGEDENTVRVGGFLQEKPGNETGEAKGDGKVSGDGPGGETDKADTVHLITEGEEGTNVNDEDGKRPTTGSNEVSVEDKSLLSTTEEPAEGIKVDPLTSTDAPEGAPGAPGAPGAGTGANNSSETVGVHQLPTDEEDAHELPDDGDEEGEETEEDGTEPEGTDAEEAGKGEEGGEPGRPGGPGNTGSEPDDNNNTEVDITEPEEIETETGDPLDTGNGGDPGDNDAAIPRVRPNKKKPNKPHKKGNNKRHRKKKHHRRGERPQQAGVQMRPLRRENANGVQARGPLLNQAPVGQANAAAAAAEPAAAAAADAAAAGGGGGGRNCFPADSLVTTVMGIKRMDELNVGDYVLVPSAGNVLRYERIEMFYHREPQTVAEFYVLETEMGRQLSLTDRHLLPTGNCRKMQIIASQHDGIETAMRESRYASRAKEGECVLSVGMDGEIQADRIVKISRRISKGIYSPMTVEGSLLADGVLTSCFSHFESHTVHKMIFDLLVYVKQLTGQFTCEFSSNFITYFL